MVLTSAKEGDPPLCLRFTGPSRFESWDPCLVGWFSGDYADVSDDPYEPDTTGAFSLTWDPDNDPDEFELVARLMFDSETTGTHEWTYTEHGEVLNEVQGDFEIVEGAVDEAECGV